LPDVELLDGVAEAIPLPDASVDTAAVGQAFHWFDGDRALTESCSSGSGSPWRTDAFHASAVR